MQPQPLYTATPPVDWPPLASVAVAACLASATGPLPTAWCLCFGLAAAICALGRHRFQVTCCALAAMGLVGARGGPELPAAWVRSLDGDLVRVTGTLMTTPTTAHRTTGPMAPFDHRSQATRFTLLVDTFHQPGQRLRPVVPALLHVRVDGDWTAAPGQQVTATGWLRRSRDQRWGPMLFVSTPTVVTVCGPVLESPVKHLRDWTRDRLLGGLGDRQRSLVAAVVLGERGADWNNLADPFRRSGLAHLLAVSGMHVAMVAAAAAWGVRLLGLGQRAGLLAGCCALALQVMIVPLRSPVLRAAIVASAGMGAALRGRSLGGTGLLALAALCILAVDPSAAQGLAFQLSFAVVLGLCVLLPRVTWRWLGQRDLHASPVRWLGRHVASAWIACLVAWTVATPIILLHFGAMAPVALVASVPGTSALGLVLVLSMTRLAVGWTHPLVDDMSRWGLETATNLLDTLAGAGAALPLGHSDGHATSAWWTAGALVWVTWWALATRRRRWVWVALPAVLVMMPLPTPAGGLTLTTLDVGHGTSHIVQVGKTAILVDGGSRGDLAIGAHVIVPALRALGVSRLEAVLITHGDLDHCSGLIEVLDGMPVGRLVTAPQTLQRSRRGPLGVVLKHARGMDVPIEAASAGWMTTLGPATMRLLAPRRDLEVSTANAASLVIAINVAGRRILLTGDIDETGIAALQPGAVDILELPHHGQWSEESVDLVARCGAAVLVQSTNMARHARDRWKDIPADRLVTCVDGTITTHIDDTGAIHVSAPHLPGGTIRP